MPITITHQSPALLRGPQDHEGESGLLRFLPLLSGVWELSRPARGPGRPSGSLPGWPEAVELG